MPGKSLRALVLTSCLSGALAGGWAQDRVSSGMTTKGAMTIRIAVGTRAFLAAMYDNATTRTLLSMLPMTVAMSELNGREKFCKLPWALPAEATEKPATIEAGEIMCWSSDCLVLFYRSFGNSYGGYVRLGRILDVTGLEEALGKSGVTVTFSLE